MRTIGLTASLLAAALSCGTAGPAAAQAPKSAPKSAAGSAPAPAEAANVVVIAIAGVTEPGAGSGICTVKGQVRQVERGTLFGVGQNVSFAVPCRKGAKAGAKAGTELDRLTASPYGRAALDAKGNLLPGRYEILDDAPPPPSE